VWFGWSIVAASIVFGIAFANRQALLSWLLVPGGGELSPFDGKPIVTSPDEAIAATMGAAARVGIIVGVLVFQLGLFSMAGPARRPRFESLPLVLQRLASLPFLPIDLYRLLRAPLSTSLGRWLAIIFVTADVCFIGGAAFSYYVMMPVFLDFLLRYAREVAEVNIALAPYLDLLYSMMLWMGVIFLLPMLMFLLTKSNLASRGFLGSARKALYPAALAFAAFIGPGGEWVTTVMIFAPIVLLYEFGLFLAWLARPDADNYMFARKVGRCLRWLLTLPAAVLRGLAYVPARAWRRLRRWRG